MWKLPCLSILVCLAWGFFSQGNAAPVSMPNPEDGGIRKDIFTNEYFNLSYPLPPGWTEGTPGPGPSRSGYYVLSTLIPAGDFTGTILIAAQDMFFGGNQFGDGAVMAHELSRTMSQLEGMTIDRPASDVQVAGRRFVRVDFSGLGLFRSTLITAIRCHLVSFNLTATSPELLAELADSLNNLGFAGDSGAGRVDPKCVSNHADTQHLLTKVDPVATGPTFTPVPVRIIIGTDGSVKHVHVISATVEQRDSIENALGRWRFQAAEMGSRFTEIEIGLILEFRSGGAVKYSAERLLSPQSSN
jgi:hypothetical protein